MPPRMFLLDGNCLSAYDPASARLDPVLAFSPQVSVVCASLSMLCQCCSTQCVRDKSAFKPPVSTAAAFALAVGGCIQSRLPLHSLAHQAAQPSEVSQACAQPLAAGDAQSHAYPIVISSCEWVSAWSQPEPPD